MHLPRTTVPRVTLPGDRVTLRPLAEADLVHGYRWERDPEVQYWAQGDIAPDDLTFAEYRARFAPPFGNPGVEEHYAITVQPDAALPFPPDGVIGYTGYFAVNMAVAAAAIGIVIGEKAYWGHGYGREAFTLLLRHLFADLGMQRVGLDTWSGNERAVRAYRAVGFREEGRLRRAQIVGGRYYDTVLMGILREEFDG